MSEYQPSDSEASRGREDAIQASLAKGSDKMTNLKLKIDYTAGSLPDYIATVRNLLNVAHSLITTDADDPEYWKLLAQSRHAEPFWLSAHGCDYIYKALKAIGAESCTEGTCAIDVTDEQIALCFLWLTLEDEQIEFLKRRCADMHSVTKLNPQTVPELLVRMFEDHANKDWVGKDYVGKTNVKLIKRHIPPMLVSLSSMYGIVEECWQALKWQLQTNGACYKDLSQSYQGVVIRLVWNYLNENKPVVKFKKPYEDWIVSFPEDEMSAGQELNCGKPIPQLKDFYDFCEHSCESHPEAIVEAIRQMAREFYSEGGIRKGAHAQLTKIAEVYQIDFGFHWGDSIADEKHHERFLERLAQIRQSREGGA